MVPLFRFLFRIVLTSFAITLNVLLSEIYLAGVDTISCFRVFRTEIGDADRGIMMCQSA
jgi:hypothetical protein